MNLLFFADDNYVRQLKTTLYSIFCNNNYTFNIYIYGIKNNKKRLNIASFINKYQSNVFFIDGFPTSFLKYLHVNDSTSVFLNKYIYYCLPPSVDKVLYLDCDIIVQKDIKSFYCQSFYNHSLIVTKDKMLEWGPVTMPNGIISTTYFNAGVLLLNLEKIKSESSLDTVIEWLNKWRSKLSYDDQDIMNMMYNNDKLVMETHYYNYCIRHREQINNGEYRNASIIHFYYQNNKPWKYNYYNRFGFKIYWKYAKHIFGYHVFLLHYVVYLFKIHIHFYFGYFKSRFLSRGN